MSRRFLTLFGVLLLPIPGVRHAPGSTSADPQIAVVAGGATYRLPLGSRTITTPQPDGSTRVVHVDGTVPDAAVPVVRVRRGQIVQFVVSGNGFESDSLVLVFRRRRVVLAVSDARAAWLPDVTGRLSASVILSAATPIEARFEGAYRVRSRIVRPSLQDARRRSCTPAGTRTRALLLRRTFPRRISITAERTRLNAARSLKILLPPGVRCSRYRSCGTRRWCDARLSLVRPLHRLQPACPLGVNNGASGATAHNHR